MCMYLHINDYTIETEVSTFTDTHVVLGKCLSMHQPWASLLVCGIKRYVSIVGGAILMKVTAHCCCVHND